jgi:hypothetical protein
MLTRKSIFIAIMVLTMLAISTLSAFAAPPAQDSSPRTITVTGFGTAFGAPTVARIGLGVEAANADILVAMDEVNTTMNAVIAILSENGIAPEDIRTEHYSIYQDYGNVGPMVEGQEPARVYRVSTGIAITVRNTNSAGEIIAAAVSAGANMVNYIQFDIEDRAALQAEARQLAVTDAQARAEHLSGLVGMTVGAPLSVREGDENFAPPGIYGGGGGGGIALDAAPPISQGQLSVSISVTITFALETE